VNLGIREQLLVSVAGGMALTGIRPIAHTFAPFLVERPFEQVKLDLGHQDVGAVLVSYGGSYDMSAAGRTHQSPADIALMDSLPGWTIHVPGHPAEAVGPVLDQVLAATDTMDVAVAYTSTVRPLDGAGLRSAVLAAQRSDVVLVEPYLAGTSAHLVNAALEDLPHRVRSLGVSREFEVRMYGSPTDHDRVHGLDPAGIAAAVRSFLR
jgi:transketolase